MVLIPLKSVTMYCYNIIQVHWTQQVLNFNASLPHYLLYCILYTFLYNICPAKKAKKQTNWIQRLKVYR